MWWAELVLLWGKVLGLMEVEEEVDNLIFHCSIYFQKDSYLNPLLYRSKHTYPSLKKGSSSIESSPLLDTCVVDEIPCRSIHIFVVV